MKIISTIKAKLWTATTRAIVARALWAGAAAVVAYLSTLTADVPPAYAPIVAILFSSLKSWIGTKFGTTGTPTFSAGSIEA